MKKNMKKQNAREPRVSPEAKYKVLPRPKQQEEQGITSKSLFPLVYQDCNLVIKSNKELYVLLTTRQDHMYTSKPISVLSLSQMLDQLATSKQNTMVLFWIGHALERVAPNSPLCRQLLLHRARTYVELCKYEEARVDLVKILARLPFDLEARYMLAQVYDAVGMQGEAIMVAEFDEELQRYFMDKYEMDDEQVGTKLVQRLAHKYCDANNANGLESLVQEFETATLRKTYHGLHAEYFLSPLLVHLCCQWNGIPHTVIISTIAKLFANESIYGNREDHETCARLARLVGLVLAGRSNVTANDISQCILLLLDTWRVPLCSATSINITKTILSMFPAPGLIPSVLRTMILAEWHQQDWEKLATFVLDFVEGWPHASKQHTFLQVFE